MTDNEEGTDYYSPSDARLPHAGRSLSPSDPRLSVLRSEFCEALAITRQATPGSLYVLVIFSNNTPACDGLWLAPPPRPEMLSRSGLFLVGPKQTKSEIFTFEQEPTQLRGACSPLDVSVGFSNDMPGEEHVS